MKQFSINDVLDLNPCSKYTREYLAKLYAGRDTINIADVIDMQEVSAEDCVWLFCKVAETDRQKIVFSLKCAEDAGFSASDASDAARYASYASDAARYASYASDAASDASDAARYASYASDAARYASDAARERQLLFILETICEEEGFEIEVDNE